MNAGIAHARPHTPRPPQAKASDLLAAFGSEDQLAAALIILASGEFEVGDKERAAHLEALFRDVATIVADKCVNPETSRPYTVSILEKALREIGFNVSPSKSAKAQALKAIAALAEYLPLARARMRLRISVSFASAGATRELLTRHRPEWSDAAGGQSGRASSDSRFEFEPVVEPGAYRAIEEGLKAAGIVGGTVEVLAMAVASSGGGGGGGGKEEEEGEGSEGDEGADGAASGLAGLSLGGQLQRSAAEAAARGVGGASGDAASAGPSNAAAVAAATAATSRGTGGAVRRVAMPGRRMACGACGLTFEDAEAHREHHKMDLHRFNLKRKVKGLAPMGEGEYEALPPKERAAFLDQDV